jgi:hypothetical protein
MTATELPTELREHLLSVVEIAQEIVVSGLESGAEHAEHVIPDLAARLTERLPAFVAGLDRVFDRTEAWLSNP